MKRRGKYIEFTQIDTRESGFDETKELISLRETLIGQVVCDPDGFAIVTTTDGRTLKSDEEYETFMTVLSREN